MSASGLSEEELNAFVDGQLSAADRARVRATLDLNEPLQKRVAEMQQMRSLLRHAYAQPPSPPYAAALPRAWARQAFAATMLLCVGAILGGTAYKFSSTGDSAAPQNLGTLKGVVIQVSKDDPVEWATAINNARNVRKAYQDHALDVEIVAYGPGLSMLRNNSPVSEGLEEAQKDGVKLLACANTMRATHITRQDLHWLVDVVPAGIIEVLQKQSEGYAYLRP